MSDAPQTPPPTPAPEGLSDTAASGLAYLTFIPAIIFLVVAPYNTKPLIKFHAWQCIGLTVVSVALQIILMMLLVIPVLGILTGLLGMVLHLGIIIIWLIAMINAFQGKRFNIPAISGFAAKQAGL